MNTSKFDLNRKYKLILVAGARPNFMKIAPIVRTLRAMSHEPTANKLAWKLVHTGQHYDYEMSQAFFDDLEIPEPDYFLEAGSGSHAIQTAKIMTAFEKVCERERPDVVIVVGDCVFRSIPATYSGTNRPPIPLHSGHPFRSIPATLKSYNL